jgi:hypothetical protein
MFRRGLSLQVARPFARQDASASKPPSPECGDAAGSSTSEEHDLSCSVRR